MTRISYDASKSKIYIIQMQHSLKLADIRATLSAIRQTVRADLDQTN